MHGLGNDYIYFDFVKTNTPPPYSPFSEKHIDKIDWATIARQCSDRHRGIGGDGIVLLLHSDNCDFRMRIFNADGSEAEMCGNATRCIGKYVYEHKLTDKTHIRLETRAGVRTMQLHIEEERVQSVSVDMGIPRDIETLDAFPFTGLHRQDFIGVDMGNPHAVLFHNAPIDTLAIHHIGETIAHASIFPNGTNVEFLYVLNRNEIQMRVWERGSGETMACGTGACASVAAAYHLGMVEQNCVVHLLGGDLYIQIQDDGHIIMSGEANEVFTGKIIVER